VPVKNDSGAAAVSATSGCALNQRMVLEVAEAAATRGSPRFQSDRNWSDMIDD